MNDARDAARLLGLMLRLHPVLRGLLLLKDLYDLYQWYMAQGPTGNWTNCTLSCSPPLTDNGPYYHGQNGGCAPAFFCHQLTPTNFPNDYTKQSVSESYEDFIGRPIIQNWWVNPSYPADPGGPPVSQPAPAYQPYIPLWRYPWVDPMVLPILQPVPVPLPPPFRHIPDRVLDPNSERGNAPPLARLPNYGPAADIPIAWGAAPRGRQPPPRKGKEKKFRANTVANVIASALRTGAIVDSKLKDLRDILKALNDNLLPQHRLKGKDAKVLQKLLRNVWDHLDDLGRSDEARFSAFLDILKEIGEDLIGGAGDYLRTEAARRNGWFKTKIFTNPRF